jgi:hypothetical protein
MEQQLGEKIGDGGCAEVFLWEKDKVLKLFRSNTDQWAVRKEYTNSLLAWQGGLPAARPYEMLEVNGLLGIIFGKVTGVALMEVYMKDLLSSPGLSALEPGLSAATREMVCLTARVLHLIHSTPLTGLPPQRDSLAYGIARAPGLHEHEKKAVLAKLAQLPAASRLCHGDPNPGNIMLRDGSPVIIDWMDASIGNPEADLAEYIIMIRYSVLPPEVPKEAALVFDSVREPMIALFLEEYAKLSGQGTESVEPWLMIAAARKLSADAISLPEKERLATVVRKSLAG